MDVGYQSAWEEWRLDQGVMFIVVCDIFSGSCVIVPPIQFLYATHLLLLYTTLLETPLPVLSVHLTLRRNYYHHTYGGGTCSDLMLPATCLPHHASLLFS